MVLRSHPRGRLVFDRDAIVRAALRAYVESIVARLPNGPWYRVCENVDWTGDVQRGAFHEDDGCGAYSVIAWTEAGVVGLAYELGFGPIEQLGLSVDAVTGGPDDVRGALPGLPDELEPALVMAVGMLGVGPVHGEMDAGVGFWLYGDRVAGTLFDDPTLLGARRLVPWGSLQGGRLPLWWSPEFAVLAAERARTRDAPIHALLDAVVDRRMQSPTEFTTDELATLLPKPPDPKVLLGKQRWLQEVGITWPGSPELPPLKKPRKRGRDPFLPNPPTTPPRLLECRPGRRDAIVRAALRAYVENTLARLDPLDRHPFAASFVPRWTGNLKQGAFSNGDGHGSYEVMAWTETGVVALAYEFGWGPIEQLNLAVDAVKGGPDDVRAALPLFPPELEPALEMAVSMLEVGAHGEKLAGVGFWLDGDHILGLHLYDPGLALAGAPRLSAWGWLKGGRLRRWVKGRYPDGIYVADLGPKRAAPIHALADAVTDRALHGPTELLPDELATLLPTPPDPERLLDAQRKLQKVGITWPGSPEIPGSPSARPENVS
jgi:hypothetical protein